MVKVSLLVAMGLMPFSGCGDGDAPDGEGSAGSGDAGEGPDGTAAGMGGGGATSVVEVGKCTSPVEDAATGLVACAEGFSHRPEPATCGDVNAGGQGGAGYDLPRAPNNVPCGAGGAGGASEDCGSYYLGYCRESLSGLAAPSECASGCVQDSDCSNGYACVCGDSQSPSGGVCVPGNCATDADCGDGLLCAIWQDACGEPWFSCQTVDDECLSDNDCEGEVCEVSESIAGSSMRVCVEGAVCGRPFLVESTARVAPVVDCRKWSAKLDTLPSLAGLGDEERAALAAHFSKLGQMEHASIAAFARFNLQLLSLGAPPELVEACTAAMADETAHTRLCFAIASHYAGRPRGPSRLNIGGSLEAASLLEVAKLVIAEGCLGETVAAVEALEAAEAASDPALRDAYARIAADEQRHAELAFRFLRWALERDGNAVRTCLAAAIDAPPLASAYGALAVTVPCLQALLCVPAPTAAVA